MVAQLFADFDDDRDRFLSKDEFVTFYSDAAGKSGFEDLRAWAASLEGADENEALFDRIDNNGNGRLADSELDAFLTSELSAGTDTEPIVINILDTYAKTAAGSLNFGEFVAFIDGLPKDGDRLPDFLSLIRELTPEEEFARAETSNDDQVSFREAGVFFRSKN